MPLLPRSRRGTWLLAGAVWLMACAGLWCALPVVPRAILHLPKNADLLTLGPDGTSALIVRDFRNSESEPNNQNALELVEVPSVRLLRRLIDHSGPLDLACQSADRHTLILHQCDEPKCRLLHIDLRSGAITPLRLSDGDQIGLGVLRLSPDARLLMVPTFDDKLGMRIYDLAANRLQTVVPGIRPPAEFSADGQFVVGNVGEDRNKIALIDLHSLKTKRIFATPPGSDPQNVAISNSGTVVFARYRLDSTPGTGVVAWNIADGSLTQKVCDPAWQVYSPEDYRFLVSNEWMQTSSAARCIELIRPLPIRLSDLSDGAVEASPAGQWIVVYGSRTQDSIIQQLACRFGIQLGDLQSPIEYRLFDSRSAKELPGFSIRQRTRVPDSTSRGAWTTNAWDGMGRTLAVHEPWSQFDYQIWDIPARKSLPWFATGAALLALPIALVARRRVRKLGVA